MSESSEDQKSRPRKKAVPATVEDDALPPVIEAGTARIETAAQGVKAVTEETIQEAPVPLASATGVEEMATAVESFPFPTNFSTEGAQAMFEDAKAKAQGFYEKGSKAVEEATELTKGNVEALVASGRAAAKGTEVILQDVASYGRKSFDSASSAVKSFAGANCRPPIHMSESEPFAPAAVPAWSKDSELRSLTRLTQPP